MVTKTQIQLGKKYEVKPKSFHRPMVGVAKKITEQGIVFHVEFCDVCDRTTAESSNHEIIAEDFDVKQAIGANCFFS